jgi:magnesium chelatase family protein
MRCAHPCPCGHPGDPRRPCTCLSSLIERYRGRISGPLLDRIDLHVALPATSLRDLGTSSSSWRRRS